MVVALVSLQCKESLPMQLVVQFPFCPHVYSALGRGADFRWQTVDIFLPKVQPQRARSMPLNLTMSVVISSPRHREHQQDARREIAVISAKRVKAKQQLCSAACHFSVGCHLMWRHCGLHSATRKQRGNQSSYPTKPCQHNALLRFRGVRWARKKMS